MLFRRAVCAAQLSMVRHCQPHSLLITCTQADNFAFELGAFNDNVNTPSTALLPLSSSSQR